MNNAQIDHAKDVDTIEMSQIMAALQTKNHLNSKQK